MMKFIRDYLTAIVGLGAAVMLCTAFVLFLRGELWMGAWALIFGVIGALAAVGIQKMEWE